jgi:hypothetical protein
MYSFYIFVFSHIHPIKIQEGFYIAMPHTGADPGFQVKGGAYLKKLCRAEGGAKIVGVFCVKNHDFTPKNHIFFQLPREV